MDRFWSGHFAVAWLTIAAMTIGVVVAIGLLLSGADRRPRPFAAYLSDPEAEIGHIVMLTSMIVMVADRGSIPHSLWRIVFGALAAGYVALLIMRAGQRRAEHAAAAGYHCLSALAMLYTTLGLTTHAQHHMAMPATGPPVPWLGWILVTFFLLDAVATITVTVRTARAAVVPHVVMDGGMVLMLIAVI